MAVTFIALNGNNRRVTDLLRAVELAYEAKLRLTKIISSVHTMLDDPVTPTNFSVFETQYGLASGGRGAGVRDH